MENATPKSRRFQFSLRDLCWAVVLAAVACSWLVERNERQEVQAKLHATQKELQLTRWKEMQWLDMLHAAKNPPKPKQPFAFVDDL